MQLETAKGQDTEPNATGRDQVEDYLAELANERRTHNLPGIRRGFLIVNWLILIPGVSVRAFGDFQAGEPATGMLFLGLAAALTQLHRITLSSKQAKIAHRLSLEDDIRAVSGLIDALEWPEESVRTSAATALVRMLPKLISSDARLVSDLQRESLYRILELPTDKTYNGLQQAILVALRRIGDERSISSVEAAGKRIPTNPAERDVADAAAECLEALRERQKHSLLLRAAGVPGHPGDVLLRAHLGANPTDEELLLRPDESADH